MATTTTTSYLGRLLRQGDLWLILGLFGTVLLLILPIPPMALDLFLAVSIGISLLILLVILYLEEAADFTGDRKSTRLNSSHANISYAVFCLKKKKNTK